MEITLNEQQIDFLKNLIQTELIDTGFSIYGKTDKAIMQGILEALNNNE